MGYFFWPVYSPHKWPVMRKMFPFDDVIMPLRFYGKMTWVVCMQLRSHGITVHQASTSDAKCRLCVVQGIFLMLKILNSIYMLSLFSVLHADSENGTHNVSWPLTFFSQSKENWKIYNILVCQRGQMHKYTYAVRTTFSIVNKTHVHEIF